MRVNEYKDKSCTLFVVYVLYNWGINWIEFTIGAKVATNNGIIILIYKIISIEYVYVFDHIYNVVFVKIL